MSDDDLLKEIEHAGVWGGSTPSGYNSSIGAHQDAYKRGVWISQIGKTDSSQGFSSPPTPQPTGKGPRTGGQALAVVAGFAIAGALILGAMQTSNKNADYAQFLKEGRIASPEEKTKFSAAFPKALIDYMQKVKAETLTAMVDRKGPRNDGWGKAYDRLFVNHSPLFLRVTARRLDQSERHIHAALDNFKLPFNEKARSQKCYCVRIDTMTKAGSPLGCFDLLLCEDNKQRYVFSIEGVKANQARVEADMTRLENEEKYESYIKRHPLSNPSIITGYDFN